MGCLLACGISKIVVSGGRGGCVVHPRAFIYRYVRYHTTVTSGLRAVAQLARASPWVAVITAPIANASQIAARQVQRYPTISADHGTRTALRRAGLPAVHLVIMPPDAQTVTMLLLSNVIPLESRENWQLALDPDWPLIWRNYQLARSPSGAVTWRLSEQARGHYRQRINRLITGRGGVPALGQRPYQLPPETARLQVLRLAEHLCHYPGFSGIRSDVFALAQHSTRVWTRTHSDEPYPVWPTMPYARCARPQTAPLASLNQEENNYETDE